MRIVYSFSFEPEDTGERVYLVSMPKNKPSKMMGDKYRSVCYVKHAKTTFVSATDQDCEMSFEYIDDDDAVRYVATGTLPKYLKDKKEAFE